MHQTRRPERSARRAPPEQGAELGRLGEQLAAHHLERRGYVIVERNVRTRGGEIDLIAFDGRALAFVEVKCARAGLQVPAPLERLRPRQRARLRRLAAAWLCDRSRARPRAQVLRLDAIGVTVDRAGRLLALEHVEDAW